MIEKENEFKWYIITAINGNEDTVYKNLEDKIRGYQLNDLVHEIKLLKSREITIDIFDNKINPPPKNMRNTKSITWETLPGNKYKKTRIREINRFPGYIYIKMIMTSEVWYAIRNTFGVTGFVGSSGKGASPIPMSEFEVQELFKSENNKDIIINNSSFSYVDNNIESGNAKEVKVEFFDNKANDEQFYDSKKYSEKNEEIFNTESVANLDNKADIYSNINIEDSNTNGVSNEIYSITNDDEIDENISSIDKASDKIKNTIHDFKIGNKINILSGGMTGQSGIIIDISLDRKIISVEVDLFGRKTNLSLNYTQIEKSSN